MVGGGGGALFGLLGVLIAIGGVGGVVLDSLLGLLV